MKVLNFIRSQNKNSLVLKIIIFLEWGINVFFNIKSLLISHFILFILKLMQYKFTSIVNKQ